MSALKKYKEKDARMFSLLENNKSMLWQIDDYSLAKSIALTIHNQMLHNATDMSDFIRQVSVPSVIHSIASLPHDIASIQPFENEDDTGCYFFTQAAEPESIDWYPIKQKKEVNVSVKDIPLPIAPHDIAVHCMELACCITDETVHEITTTLAAKAEGCAFFELTSSDNLLDALKHASERIRRRTKRSATFVVLPVAMARLLKKHIASDYDFDSLPINVRRIGVLQNRWTVYINAYEQKKIIMGYRGVHPIDAGIAFSPYVLFWQPVKNQENDRHTVHKRYQITVTNPEYYSCLEIADNKAASTAAF